jgi:SAM-dependent methyltransferase
MRVSLPDPGVGSATNERAPSGPQTHNCPACGAAARPWAHKNQTPLSRCLGCGTLFSPASAIAAAELYAPYYEHARFEIPDLVVASLDRVVLDAEPCRETGRWLDIGFGEGALLAVAERRGWICHGTEVPQRVLDYGRARGWTVASDSTDGDRFPPGGFDVVTMIELLEHVPEPTCFLANAARLLRPGGLLYLTTPNAWSLNRWWLGVSWSIFNPPEHLTIWTPRGMRRALVRVGFQEIRLRTEGLNPAEIVAGIKSVGRVVPPVNRNAAGLALNAALSRSRLRRAFKRTANGALTALQVGDTIKVWARRGPLGPAA